METRPLSSFPTPPCCKAATNCDECIGHSVHVAVDESKLPRCMLCRADMEESQAQSLLLCFYQRNPTHTPKHPTSTLAKLYLRRALAAIGAIACPSPGCLNAVVPSTPGELEKCKCEECGVEFCSLCKDVFHYEVSCQEARSVGNAWDVWLREGREKHMRVMAMEDAKWKQRLQHYHTLRDKHSKEVEAAMARRAELQKDEEWKEQHCRICPHCKRPVEKLEGCDLMRCGYDVDTKANQQNGCGEKFYWTKAEPYKASASGGPQLPAFDERAPRRERRAFEICPGIALSCSDCGKALFDIAFRCINCCGQYTICAVCEVEKPKGEHGGGQHVFRVLRAGRE